MSTAAISKIPFALATLVLLSACGGQSANQQDAAVSTANDTTISVAPASTATSTASTSATSAAASTAASAATNTVTTTTATATTTAVTDATAITPVVAATTAVTPGFAVTEANSVLTVTTGAGLVFTVNELNGNILTITYNGSKNLQQVYEYSQISSGISAPVTYTVSGNVAKLTLTTATLTHYMLVRGGENTIYMGTYTTAEPAVGEQRWITRLAGAIFTDVPAESNIRANTGNVESEDIFGSADGTTQSKYYGNQRAMDYTLRGVSGTGIAAYMVYGNRESSSGGPFYRDIQNQSGSASELYNYMNSGHNQTEAIRTGFHGPYALMFTSGEVPAIPDMSWMGDYALSGWVAEADRGRVIGNGITGLNAAFAYTVGFANATAQYWTSASASTGSFGSYKMKPGVYQMTVYKGELSVYTKSVTVTAGAATTLNTFAVTDDPGADTVLWHVGVWDGTPLEFLNGAELHNRHPMDTRNTAWGPVDFLVGNADSTFPAVQFVGVNNNNKITFNLTAAQVAAHTIRIGITGAYAGGRPNILVNAWTPKQLPTASSQPDSRSFTTGSYRGNNTMYTYAVPASAFVVGSNSVTISTISGQTGTTYLSPAFAYDAIDML